MKGQKVRVTNRLIDNYSLVSTHIKTLGHSGLAWASLKSVRLISLDSKGTRVTASKPRVVSTKVYCGSEEEDQSM